MNLLLETLPSPPYGVCPDNWMPAGRWSSLNSHYFFFLYRQLVPHTSHRVRHILRLLQPEAQLLISSVVGGRQTSTWRAAVPSKIQSPQWSAELCFSNIAFIKSPLALPSISNHLKYFPTSFWDKPTMHLRLSRGRHAGFKPHLIVCVSKSAGQQRAGSDSEVPLTCSLENFNCKF